MNVRVLALLAALLFFGAGQAAAEWTFTVSTGSAYSLPMWMKVQQYGEDDLEFTGHFQTRALSTMAPYYDFKISKWDGDTAWEFESLHHKVHLVDGPDEIQRFIVSHGYNMNMVNRAYRMESYIYRFGGGLVMTHPETTVRNKPMMDDGGVNGFYISGICAQTSIEKQFFFTEDDKWYLSIEGKLTVADAVFPIAGGEAHLPNVALHGLFGVGYVF